jgi:hypothetical protein
MWAASLATRHKASVSWGETRVAEGEEWRLCRCGWRTESMRSMFFVFDFFTWICSVDRIENERQPEKISLTNEKDWLWIPFYNA